MCVCVCPCICAIQQYGSIYSHAKGLTTDRGPGPGNILAITALLLRCCSFHRPYTLLALPSLWLKPERGSGGFPLCWCLPPPLSRLVPTCPSSPISSEPPGLLPPQPPPDNPPFLLQILSSCSPAALSLKDMFSLLPGSLRVALLRRPPLP